MALAQGSIRSRALRGSGSSDLLTKGKNKEQPSWILLLQGLDPL